MSLGYSNKVIKSKQDKGQYLSQAEQDYIDMEALQAAEQFVSRNHRKGSAFIRAALGKAAELLSHVENEERAKQGKRPQEQPKEEGNQELRRRIEAEPNIDDPFDIFGRGGR